MIDDIKMLMMSYNVICPKILIDSESHKKCQTSAIIWKISGSIYGPGYTVQNRESLGLSGRVCCPVVVVTFFYENAIPC